MKKNYKLLIFAFLVFAIHLIPFEVGAMDAGPITDCPPTRAYEGCAPSDIGGPDLPLSLVAATVPDFAALGGVLDPACVVQSMTYIDVVAGACPWTITRTYTITDVSGIVVQCDQSISITDSGVPVFSSLPPNITVECDAIPPMEVLTYTDCDMTNVIVTNEVSNPGTCPSAQNIIRSWSITDGCGNLALHNQLIVVEDNTPPVAVAQDLQFNVASVGETVTITAADIENGSTDNCSTVNLMFAIDMTVLACGDNIVTLSVTDECGNVGTSTSTVTVIAPAGEPARVTNDFHCADKTYIAGPKLTAKCEGTCGGVLSWWDAPTGGTMLHEGETFDPVVDGGANPSLVQCNIFYADCGDGNRSPAVFEVIDCDTDCTDGCEYYLVLEDAGFNGWDGASIDVSINEAWPATNYKVNNTDCASSYKVIPLSVTDGATIDLAYWNGALETEHAWKLLDAGFNTILATGYDADACNTTAPAIASERTKAACPTCCIDETEDYTVRIRMGQFPEEHSWEIYSGTTDQQGTQVIGINATTYTGVAPGSTVTYDFSLNKCETYTFVAFDGFNDSWNGGTWEIITSNVDYGTEITNPADPFLGNAVVLSGPADANFIDEDRVTFTIPCAPTCEDVVEINVDDCEVTDLDLPIAPPTICYPNCNHALGCDLTVQHIVLPFGVDYDAIAGAATPYTGSGSMIFSGALPAGAHELVTKYTYCDGVMVKCTTDLVITGDTNPSMTCNDNVIISLAIPTSPAGPFTYGECIIPVTPDAVLEMPDVCDAAYTVTILDANENPLVLTGANGLPLDVNGNQILPGQNTTPANNLVGPAQAGQTLTYVAEHIYSGNKCWGTVTIEDKQAPVITCFDYDLACTHPNALDENYTHTETYVPAMELPANIAGGTGGTASNTFIPVNLPCGAFGEIIQNIQVTLDVTHSDVTDLAVILHAPTAAGLAPITLANPGQVGATNVFTPAPASAPGLLAFLGQPCSITESTQPQDFVTENSGNNLPTNAGGTWYIQVVDNNATFPTPPYGGGEATAASISLTCGFPVPVAAYDCTLESITLISEIVEETLCDQSDWNGAVITRVWQAADAFGFTSVCTQTVGLKAPTFDQIVWPRDMVLDCNGDTDPVASTGVLGYDCFPITADIAHGLCDISYTYEDQVFDICGNGKKIYRHWTAINWCSGNTINYTQVIKLEDQTGPVINIDNIVANTDTYDCSANIQFNEAVTDACSFVTSITVSYNENGGSYGSDNFVIVDVTNGGTLSNLPLGVTELLIRAKDECLNETEELVSITIEDNTNPVATCNDHFNVSLGSDGQAWIYAADIDEGSWDNCGIASLEVRRVDGCLGTSAWADSAPVDCCDLNENVTIELRVTDNAGNSNVCWQTVLVEDALAPTITCPDNVTVDCNDPVLHDLAGLAVFGDAIAEDNCTTVVDYSENDGRDQCKAGVITRTWNVDDNSDKSGSASCQQRITVNHVSDFIVQFPADVTISTCPDDLGLTGAPTLSADDCELVAINHDDLILTIVDDACYAIERTWTLVNWCVYDEGNPANTDLGIPQPLPRTYQDDDGYFTYIQIIRVLDSDAPVITCPSDQTFCDLTDGCEGQADLTIEVVDGCSPDEVLEYTYKIDAFNDGSFDIIETGSNDATGVYPYGTHLIQWIVEDGCGNTSACSYLFTIEDCKNPTPVCLNGLSIENMQTGCVEIWASDFLEYAFDNCTESAYVEASVKMRRNGTNDPLTTKVELCCVHLGTNLFDIWVEDEAGNADYCTTYIVVQDNLNNCSHPKVSIAGKIENEAGEGIENVEVSINGNTTMNSIVDGIYAFQNLDTNLDYEVRAEKDVDPLNGVSTFDLVLMSQHILGITELDSPYKMIAADVNNDGNISTFDVVQTRQLILFIINDFPTNTSWRFVNADYVFPNAANPWLQAFPERVNYNSLTQNQLATDFVGIKIGDVSGDAVANSLLGADDRNLNGTLQFDIEEATLEAGQTYQVDFRANDFQNIRGFQYTLGFDQTALTFNKVESGALDMTEGNLGLTMLNEGVITTSWNTPESKSASNNEVLFSLTFTAKAATTLSEALNISSRYTQTEAYNATEMMDVAIAFNGDNGSVVSGAQFELFQNTPNPFSGETVIGFNLAQASKATLTISDISGRTLKVITNDYAQGYNQVTLSKSDLNVSGVLYYELNTETDSATKKMVVIE